MFTGLIEEVGQLKSIEMTDKNQAKIKISCKCIQDDLSIGDSVAVNGACLTIIDYNSHQISMELSEETLNNTVFFKKKKSTLLNLERALKVGDRIGGHFVQGHVDSIATVLQKQEQGKFYEFTFLASDSILPYLVPKGSIAIDGISLTIAKQVKNKFSIAVIPHTYKMTNLKELEIGTFVHIETDMLGKYVFSNLKQFKTLKNSSINFETLEKSGW